MEYKKIKGQIKYKYVIKWRGFWKNSNNLGHFNKLKQMSSDFYLQDKDKINKPYLETTPSKLVENTKAFEW
jgi:hypothetical protein